MMDITALPLQDAKMLRLPAFSDHRGSFVKTFHDTALSAGGIDFTLKESYFSVSGQDVIRGMHFQVPPHQHSKIVFCPAGAILDVIIDLRRNSPTYGRHHAEILSGENHLACYIPEGFAHGFKALTADAITYYLVSSEHAPASDAGIRWDSFGYDWACPAPVMSARDQAFGSLSDFRSPF